MTAADFEQLWATRFALPLRLEGFEPIGRSKGLIYAQDDWEVAVLRPYGRFVAEGTAPVVIGFRHRFLRPISSDDPKRAKDWVDYLRGGRPMDVAADVAAFGAVLPFQSDMDARDRFRGPSYAQAVDQFSDDLDVLMNVVLP